MGTKTVTTKEDFKGIIFLTDYIHSAHFSGASNLETEHFSEVSDLIEKETGRKVSDSTIARIFKFKTNPTRLTYKKLDTVVYWCFKGDYFNFKEFVDENIEELVEIELSEYELKVILEKLSDKDKAKTSLVNQNQTIQLAGSAKGLQINLDEGVVSNLLESVASRVGDLLSNEIEKQRTSILETNNQRINTRLYLTELARQENTENIIAKALKFAAMYEGSDEIADPDWIAEFFNISQDCSNERMQFLWAKILASEVDEPGTFTRRALNAIKLLSSEEASLFSLMCNCLWVIHPGETRSDLVLLKNSDNKGYYSDRTWGFDGSLLRHLEDLGLVHETFMVMEKDEVYNISFFEKKHEISTDNNALEIELVRLSTVGAEIYDVVMTEKNEEYYKFTLEYLKGINLLKK